MLSSVLFAVCAVLATLGDLTSTKPVLSVAAALLGLFVFLEFRQIRLAQKIAALVLFCIAGLIALTRSEFIAIFHQGLLRTLPFLLIFAAVGWLRTAAEQSPSVHALRDALSKMQEGNRFIALNLSAHVMGAGFNLAGIGLLAPMLAGKDEDPITGRRLRCAILWGFSTASSWSPFLVGTAAVLAAIPSIRWIDTLPYGFTIATAFLFWSYFFDRITRPQRGIRKAASPANPGNPELARAVIRLLTTLAVLFAVTLLLIEGAGLALTTAIALVAPCFALGWVILISGGRSRLLIPRLSRKVISNYSGMRTETTLFVAANTFGAAVSAMLPGAMDGLSGNGVSGFTGILFLDTLAAIWAYLALCAIGIHPIVILVVLTSIVDLSALGIGFPLLGAFMMALWGMGTSVSPLSGTTLFMSQLSEASSFTIAWRWNGLFYSLAAIWLAGIVSALA